MVWLRRSETVPANPPGCRGAKDVRSQTVSPITTQRSEVVLCCAISEVVRMRVMVGLAAVKCQWIGLG